MALTIKKVILDLEPAGCLKTSATIVKTSSIIDIATVNAAAIKDARILTPRLGTRDIAAPPSSNRDLSSTVVVQIQWDC